jgi:protein TonB
VRVGGSIKEPALLHRVEPIYPALAVATGLEGAVILEAIVDRDGRVDGLRVLRSQGVLDRAALEAVRQWRYSPVLLNGRPEKFILTVVVTFRLEQR